METNGWIFDPVLYYQTGFDEECGNDTYYGYLFKTVNVNFVATEKIGTVYSTFKGNGVASLIFKNCYNGPDNDGYVSASLQSKELGRAQKNEVVNVSFNYSKDDTLLIKIAGRSIFKIKYFIIEECSKFFTFLIGRNCGVFLLLIFK